MTKRCLLVLTRDIPDDAAAGRERTMSQIRCILGSAAELRELRLKSITEHRGIAPWLAAASKWLSSLLSLRPLPLQVVLFHDRTAIEQLLVLIDTFKPDVVYFDGIRTALALQAAHAHAGHASRIVCDLDDLISRRMKLLSQMKLGISAGYLKRFIPPWFQRHVLDGPISRMVTAYEATMLQRLEIGVLRDSDCAVLVSDVDAVDLKRHAKSDSGKIMIIPPSVKQCRSMIAPALPLRFIFIGSETLTQNRLTIDWLIDVWQKYSPEVPLHLFGKIASRDNLPRNVVVEGFVDSLDEVYTASSILLAPSFLAGGIKTKILEAFSYGTIAIGNQLSFEGLGIDPRSLEMSEQRLIAFVQNPSLSLEELVSASRTVQADIFKRFAPDRIEKLWLSAAFANSVGADGGDNFRSRELI